jgi:DNA-binding CsgD family transcriptional regulator
MRQTITYLIKKGYTHREGAKRLNISPDMVLRLARKFDLKFSNIPKRPDTVEPIIIKKLVKRGYTTIEISKLLNIHKSTIDNIILKFNIQRNYKVKLSKRQKAVLIGTLLGDSSLRRTKHQTSFVGGHSLNQKEYCLWKINELKELNIKHFDSLNKKPDNRTHKVYKNIQFYSSATESLNMFYDLSYIPNKEISEKLLKYYNALSLAVHYMDDGYIRNTSYSLCTDSFSTQSLNIFIEMCQRKFGITWRIDKRNRLYLPVRFKKTFTNLIKNYVHKTMMYKLH